MNLKASLSALALLAAATAWAQQDINQTVHTIVKNNVELKSQRIALAAQRNDDADANSLANPEFEFTRVWGHHGVGNKMQIDVSQSFDWPGLYRTRSKAANMGYTAGEMAVAASELDLAMQAKGLLLELVYIRKCLALDHTLLDNITKMQSASDIAYQSGLITILDQRKLQITRYAMEGEIASHRGREQEIISALQSMCPEAQLQLDAVTAYPIEQLLAQEEYMDQIASIDPMLLSQRLTAQQEGLNAKAATQSRLPSFSVGFEHQTELGDKFTGFTVGMSLPFFQNRKARSTAILRQDQAESSANALLAQRQAETESQLRTMQVWRNRVESYNKVFGDNSYLTLLKKALDGGEISIIEYLNETNYFHETTQAYLEAEYNYNASLAWLNRYTLLANQ